MISVMRLRIAPRASTSSGLPVMPMTPTVSPSSWMGRLTPGRMPLGRRSSWTVSRGSFWDKTWQAPSWRCPTRSGSVLAKIVPVPSMMLMSWPVISFISRTMEEAAASEINIPHRHLDDIRKYSYKFRFYTMKIPLSCSISRKPWAVKRFLEKRRLGDKQEKLEQETRYKLRRLLQ